ncbi:MurR/RpiR family transcriptional regulator [Gulosibacter faecalis]|uniref:MurR/RpiR family transcriptional regulator n=1 Tax=Gulosibacter faecalis TaxID=272240 RepID=A0ABW5UUV6_9MICO|nr:MurR/RpiR family transcriptional regulator [Gulosibacter faecalis]
MHEQTGHSESGAEAAGGTSRAFASIRAAAAALGPSEGRVAAVVLERPNEVVGWSTAELALAAETSAATVIRACQRLGFRGFQHLRLEIARATALAPQAEPGAAPDAPVDAFDESIDAIRLAKATVDPEQLERAASALGRARRIVLVGSGFSGPPLQDFAMRLSTLGRTVEAPVDALAQQFAAHSLGPDDACFVLSYSGANQQSVRAATAARERGATLVLVTSFLRSPLARLADIAVATGPAAAPHGVDPAMARIGQSVVLHALHSAMARQQSQDDVEGMRAVVADALSDDESR